MFNFRKYVWRKLWLTWVTCRVSQNVQFSKIYVLLSVVDLGDFQSSLKYFSRFSNFENMCGVISGWLGWLARMDSCEVQFSKMYVSQLLLKWVTCPYLATSFSSGSIQNIYVAFPGWLGWLAISRKIISGKNKFRKYVCRQSRLTWLTCRVYPTNSITSFNFLKYVCCNCQLTWVTFQSSLEFSQDVQFLKICVA
jgi:hypothetical protein